MIIIKNKILVTLNVIYYNPQYTNILQEFIWQTEDKLPELYRIHKFLNFWKNNINAVIKEILVSYNCNNKTEYIKVDKIFTIN